MLFFRFAESLFLGMQCACYSIVMEPLSFLEKLMSSIICEARKYLFANSKVGPNETFYNPS